MAPEPPIAVDIVPCPPAPALAAEWCALETRADGSFFQSWVWVGPRLETAGTPLWLIRARRAGQTVGLGFLAVRDETHLRLLRRKTGYFNETGDPARDVVTVEYNDLLLDRADADAIRAACLKALVAARTPAWDALFVRSCLPGVERALRDLPLLARLVGEAPAAAIDLEQARAAGGVLALASANTRQQVRRAMRLYTERFGPLVLTRAGSVDEALAFFDALAPLHQQRWTARGKPGAFGGSAYRAMHEKVIAQGFAARAVELVRIAAGDHVLGYLYNFLHRDQVCFYLSGLNYDADARLKPGMVAHVLCAQAHAEEGRARYDFMAGENRYKTSLGQPTQTMISLLLSRRAPLALLEAWLRRCLGR